MKNLLKSDEKLEKDLFLPGLSEVARQQEISEKQRLAYS